MSAYRLDPLLPVIDRIYEAALEPRLWGEVVSADQTIAPFAQAAGCSGQRTRSELPDRDPNDGSKVLLELFQGCKVPIELIRIEGGGHTLPGRPRINERGLAVGAHNNDVNATRLILDFLRRASGS